MKIIAPLLLAFGACSLPASAALVTVDLGSPGDGLLTLDTSTGLRWLDVDATLGLTAAQVLAGEGGWIRSFRYATTDEVRTLFANADLLLSGNYSLAEEPAAQRFLDLFSTTPDECGNFVCGFVPNQAGSVDIANVGIVHNALYNGGYSYIWTDIGSAESFGGSSWGSFLIQSQNVPEPSSLTLVLLAAGIAASRSATSRSDIREA